MLMPMEFSKFLTSVVLMLSTSLQCWSQIVDEDAKDKEEDMAIEGEKQGDFNIKDVTHWKYKKLSDITKNKGRKHLEEIICI